MFKTSVTTRVISFAVLLTFLLASFPTAVGEAKSNNPGLERKWAKLVTLYQRQVHVHNNAPHSVDWMINNANVSKSKKAELRKSLDASNAAWAAVPAIVMRHSGFDANGNVINKAAAQQSVKDLSKALQRHIASMKRLKALLRQFSLTV